METTKWEIHAASLRTGLGLGCASTGRAFDCASQDLLAQNGFSLCYCREQELSTVALSGTYLLSWAGVIYYCHERKLFTIVVDRSYLTTVVVSANDLLLS